MRDDHTLRSRFQRPADHGRVIPRHPDQRRDPKRGGRHADLADGFQRKAAMFQIDVQAVEPALRAMAAISTLRISRTIMPTASPPDCIFCFHQVRVWQGHLAFRVREGLDHS